MSIWAVRGGRSFTSSVSPDCNCRSNAQGDIVQLKNFTQHACFNSKHAEVLEACVLPGGDVRYHLRLLGELVGVKLHWVSAYNLSKA